MSDPHLPGPHSIDPSLHSGNVAVGDPEVEAMYAAKTGEQLDTSLEGLTTYFTDKKNWALPEPEMLRAASEVVGDYFTTASEAGNFDEDFTLNVDRVVSAAGGLLEERYEKLPKDPAIDKKIQALFSSASADAISASREPGSRVVEQPGPARARYIDIRSYTRNAEQNPATYPRLARVGADCAAILGLAADAIRTRTSLDKVSTGVRREDGTYGTEMRFSPLVFKDYIHMHVGGILESILEHRKER